MDIGDRWTQLCIVDSLGAITQETRVRTRPQVLEEFFASFATLRIALEVGNHSPWISRLLEAQGHEVLVANPRKLRLIYQNPRKDDRIDAQYLAKLARTEPSLLHPMRHRSQETQLDLLVIRARASLVEVRGELTSACRGWVKATGQRIPACSTPRFAQRVTEALEGDLLARLQPVIEMIAALSKQIRVYDREIERLADERYAQTELLRNVQGVGVLSALTYVLTLEDPQRFSKSREVGAYLGLVAGRRDSGQSHRELGITKQGDSYLRKLLTQCAHYILGPFGRDCALRRFGQRLEARGGPAAKKRAVVAVARKLACLLHHLWRSGEVYDPMRGVPVEPQLC
jgi:transposase